MPAMENGIIMEKDFPSGFFPLNMLHPSVEPDIQVKPPGILLEVPQKVLP